MMAEFLGINMKKVISSTLLSAFVFPGLGQLNNRQYVKGGIMVAIVLLSLIGFFIKLYQDVVRVLSLTHQTEITSDLITQLTIQVQQENAALIQKLIVFLLIIWIYGIIDAFIYGSKIDREKINIPM
jgi:TM2 domain-containing membrane protein YozV